MSESTNDQFQQLLSRYRTTLRTTVGCDDSVKYFIDTEYEELIQFVSSHPQFQEKLPQRPRFSLTTGLTLLIRAIHEQD